MVTWDRTLLRVDGVAILDGESRRGQTVLVSRHRTADGKVSHHINAAGDAEAAWRVAIHIVGAVQDAVITEEN